jgi:glycosyltransferase involved in cell wall biosynthesis
LLRILRPQAVVLQKARHPDNRPTLYLGFPCLFDLDDADFLDDQSRPGILECVQGSVLTIAGSEMVAQWCRNHHGKAEVVWTGSPVSSAPLPPQEGRPPILVWGASMPHGYPAEANFLQQVIRLVSRSMGRVSLKLYADDGSEQHRNLVRAFEKSGADVHPTPYLEYGPYLASLEECAIGLAPLVDVDGYSGGKSFGKVLAYLDRGVPVLTHPVVDHPKFFRHGVNGLMAHSAEEWAEHVIRLLRDADERQRLADNGRSSFRSELSMDVMTRKMDSLLRKVIAERGGGSMG